MSYLLIFVCGGLGSVMRYLTSSTIQRLFEGWLFPIGTFGVNMIGCLLIGFLGQLAEAKGFFPGEIRLAVFIGFLGGFTTFSSFGYETFQLLKDGEYLYAAANAILQMILGLICVWLGYICGRLL